MNRRGTHPHNLQPGDWVWADYDSVGPGVGQVQHTESDGGGNHWRVQISIDGELQSMWGKAHEMGLIRGRSRQDLLEMFLSADDPELREKAQRSIGRSE